MAVGNLNGKWEFMFKVVISMATVLLPLMVALFVWMVTTIFQLRQEQAIMSYKIEQFIAEGPRFTERDAEFAHMMLRQQILAEIRGESPE